MLSLTRNSYVLQAAMSIGSASNAVIATQLHQPSAHTQSITLSPLPTIQSTPTLPTSSTPVMPVLDAHESSSYSDSHATNLVKPSLFSATPSSALMMPSISSSMPTAPPLHPPVTMQHPYGTLLLLPFPPPAPSSLAPDPNYGPVVTRDKVRDTLLRLVQVILFVSMLAPCDSFLVMLVWLHEYSCYGLHYIIILLYFVCDDIFFEGVECDFISRVNLS